MKLRRPWGNKGVTLIELLLVIAILAVITAVAVPIGLDFYLSSQLVSETRLLASIFSRARTLAMINNNESSQGVYISPSEFVLFQGGSYAARETSRDNNFPRAAGISIGGPSEFVFTALSGRAASSTLTLNNGRESTAIYINEEGAINF